MENQTEIMQPEIKKGFLKRAEEIKNSIEKKDGQYSNLSKIIQ